MNLENKEMSLPDLIKKYSMQEWDTILCTYVSRPITHGTVIFTLDKHMHYSVECYCGDEGQLFKLPEDSPYLEQKHEFVRSCQPNTKENQEALFELGYSWYHGNSINVIGCNTYLYTNEDGSLTHSDCNYCSVPQRYKFETKITATLLPEEPEETEQERELRLAIEELESAKKKLEALQGKV